jgi:NAD kinase
VANFDRKAIVVTRKTRLDELIIRFNTAGQAKFYIEHSGGDFADIEKEAATYASALRTTEAALRAQCRVQVIDRSFLPTFLFGPTDIVVALGQDGLVANTMKYLDGQPLLGVNPDPHRYDGVLLPFAPRDLPLMFDEVLIDKRPVRNVTMAKAALSDGQVLYAVNDLFVGAKSHISARYVLELHGVTEQQSSSGIIVSTGLGSTAWYRSIVTGACAIAASVGFRGKVESYRALPWDSRELRFAVREPFPSVTSGTSLLQGTIESRARLTVRSLMSDHGVIFSDGIESDFLAFNSGVRAEISIADRHGLLIH